MKVLYCARFARPDILRATCKLASRVSKWTRECDRRLHKLMSYLHSTKHVIYRGYVGDEIEKCHVALFCDADYAGDKNDSKSVTGVLAAIVGPYTFMPIAFRSKKQDNVSKSTCEAEVVAMCHGLQYEGIPMLDIWDVLDPGHERRAAGGSGDDPFRP